MPALPNNVLTVKFFVTHPHGQMTSILYYEPVAPPATPAHMVIIANDFLSQLATVLTAILAQNCSLIGTYARYKSAVLDIEGYSTDAGSAGDGDPDCLDAQTCAVVRRLTGKPGRSKRGRIFISGISEGDFSDGVMVPAKVATYQAVAAFFATDITANAVIHHARHWDRKNNVMEIVTHAKCLRRIGSRRDRMQSMPYETV